jgi:hypothetical protein
MGRKVGKKDKDRIANEIDKLENEMIRDKVKEVFRTQPDNYIAGLEAIGFKYYDDDDYEEKEERQAKPENRNQRDLMAFFEGKKPLSKSVFMKFLAEHDTEEPNAPLIRRYFREANPNLKALILYGLDHYPGRIDLLFDLAYFHEFENMLSTVIKYYTRACVEQANLQTFGNLAREFYWATIADGYEALHALRELFGPHTEKRIIIDFLIEEMEAEEESDEPIDLAPQLE